MTESLGAALEAVGILFRENFTCCGCEIIEEKQPRHLGFAFFNEQDIELAALSGTLYLTFGAFAKKKTKAMDDAVGATITKVAKEQGICIQWSGSSSDRIRLDGLDKSYYKNLLLEDDKENIPPTN